MRSLERQPAVLQPMLPALIVAIGFALVRCRRGHVVGRIRPVSGEPGRLWPMPTPSRGGYGEAPGSGPPPPQEPWL
jgi:hypothetical protein